MPRHSSTVEEWFWNSSRGAWVVCTSSGAVLKDVEIFRAFLEQLFFYETFSDGVQQSLSASEQQQVFFDEF